MGKGKKLDDFNATRREDVPDIDLPDDVDSPSGGASTQQHRAVRDVVRKVLQPALARKEAHRVAPVAAVAATTPVEVAVPTAGPADPRRATRQEYRQAVVERLTKETQIRCQVDLDGVGKTQVDCEIGFFGHMLEAFGRHAHLDLDLHIRGDLHIDQHHTVEDTALVLGQALRQALGDRRGIWRSASMRFAMDETLAECAIDIAGRPHLEFHASFTREQVGDFHTDLVIEFFAAMTHSLGCNLHIELIRGHNDHHKIEAIFKAFARALELAVAVHPRAFAEVPSTKGSLDG